jgi:dTDP-4-amino-4,6-dideoxygalactose transaminase
VLGCFGDGGAVITNAAAVHDKVYQLRDHGRNAEGRIVSWGLNSRLDNQQAAFLDFQLQRYPLVVERRRAMARLYHERLQGIAELSLPPAPDGDMDHFDIYQNYEIEANRRDGLQQHLKERGVGTLIQWGGQAIHQLRELGFTQRLPFTDELFSRMLMLPINLSLADADIQYVCDQIRAYYGYPA